MVIDIEGLSQISLLIGGEFKEIDYFIFPRKSLKNRRFSDNFRWNRI